MQAFLEQSIASATSFEDRFDAEVWLLDMQARLTPLSIASLKLFSEEEEISVMRATLMGIARGGSGNGIR